MFFDDLAGKKLSSTNQNEWILLRHTIQNITHLNNGLILTFLATQRYYALDKSLRESITSLIAFSTPSNPFDASIIKRFIGEEAYAFLEFQKFLLMTRQTRKHYSAFYLNGIKGILDMPMAEIDFLRKWKFTRRIYGFQRWYELKKVKCNICEGTGEVEVLETEEEKFYREVAKPILDKAYELPTWAWWKYNFERK